VPDDRRQRNGLRLDLLALAGELARGRRGPTFERTQSVQVVAVEIEADGADYAIEPGAISRTSRDPRE
jgi:hypothetical protein